MKICDLLESQSDARIIALRAKIADLKLQRKKLVATHAGSGFQSGVDPRYAAQVKRLDAAIVAAGQDLTAALKAEQNAIDVAVAARTAAANAKPFDRIAAQRAGAEHWLQLAAKYGGEHKLNVAIENEAKKQTMNGKHRLNIESLARIFDVPASAMYRRIDTMQSLRQLKTWYPHAR